MGASLQPCFECISIRQTKIVHACLIFQFHTGRYFAKVSSLWPCSREVATQRGFGICIHCWSPCKVEGNVVVWPPVVDFWWDGFLFISSAVDLNSTRKELSWATKSSLSSLGSGRCLVVGDPKQYLRSGPWPQPWALWWCCHLMSTHSWKTHLVDVKACFLWSKWR